MPRVKKYKEQIIVTKHVLSTVIHRKDGDTRAQANGKDIREVTDKSGTRDSRLNTPLKKSPGRRKGVT